VCKRGEKGVNGSKGSTSQRKERNGEEERRSSGGARPGSSGNLKIGTMGTEVGRVTQDRECKGVNTPGGGDMGI
jgi:hypothetical protein